MPRFALQKPARKVRCARQREVARPQGCPMNPHDVELEPVTDTERGGFREEVVHSPAAAASFAESAQRDAADRYRKHPAIAVLPQRDVAGATERCRFRGG